MPTRPNALGLRYAASTGHPAASAAASDILDAGGNAVDAAAAAALVLAVAHPDLVTFFGVAAIMIRPATTGETITVAGIGGWPQAATLDHFISSYGRTIPDGLPRSVVPGAPGGWLTALRRHGSLGFAEIAEPAIALARVGCPVTDHVAHSFAQYAPQIRSMPSSAATYFRNGHVPELGDELVLDELAATLGFLADTDLAARVGGRDAGLRAVNEAVYCGDIADLIARYHAENGGLMTRSDLAGFNPEVGTGLQVRFGRAEIAVCGPWCQSPVLAQLATLHDDGSGLPDPDTELFVHRFVELTKLAMADRTAFFGDPLVTNVPMEEMLDRRYAALRRAMVGEIADPGVPPPGDPIAGAAVGSVGNAPFTEGKMPPRGNTAGISIVDAKGNLCVATVSDVAVDTPVVPGLGCPVSSRGSQGWLDPGHPAVIGPGRRPWFTACPAIVTILPDKRSFAVASAGGDVQPQAIFQTLLRILRGADPQSAIDAPRAESLSFPDSFWPHHFQRGILRLEGKLGPMKSRLEARGHLVEMVPDNDARLGAVVLAGVDARGLRFGAADARRDAVAMAR